MIIRLRLWSWVYAEVCLMLLLLIIRTLYTNLTWWTSCVMSPLLLQFSGAQLTTDAWLSPFCGVSCPSLHVRGCGCESAVNRQRRIFIDSTPSFNQREHRAFSFMISGPQPPLERGPRSFQRKMRVIGRLQLLQGVRGWCGWRIRCAYWVNDWRRALLLDDTIYWDCCPRWSSVCRSSAPGRY